MNSLDISDQPSYNLPGPNPKKGLAEGMHNVKEYVSLLIGLDKNSDPVSCDAYTRDPKQATDTFRTVVRWD